MKLTLALVQKLQRLANGETIPASQLRGEWVDELIQEQILQPETHGTKRSYRVDNVTAFLLALTKYHEALADLDKAEQLFAGHSDRADQAAIGGNSKLMAQRSCPGFLVNSYSPIDCTLHGSRFRVCPPEGSFVYIADWQSFAIPSDTLVVIIENMENFRSIRQQQGLFQTQMSNDEHKILFVSRYPQSADLRLWLCSIPNRCLHFGDFDLAGIHIFQSEIQKYLGSRSSFLIPDDIENRLKSGSRQRYDAQYQRFHHLEVFKDDRLQWLINLIHKYRRGYDQEGYIT